MTLDQLKINESAIITAINCDEILKDRLYSFGISKGVKVEIVELTLTKSTIEIKINQSKMALRLAEASKIEVAYEK
ncbi:MAG: FeoA family protein [Aliarcobacter sp.]|jgi:ferrous iron transport protein A|nr:FeoA family protein [Aliarcobacter sp.]